MSVKSVIESIAELIELHQQLNQRAAEKVDAIKANDVSTLSQLVREEAKLVRAVQIAESSRMKQAKAFMMSKGTGTEDVTVQTLLQYVTEEEKAVLLKLQKALRQEVHQLKEQSDHTRELLEESLRFVNLSLDLMVPQAEDVHYAKPQHKQEQTELYSRSVFDSKA
ncbi:flagellar protein FlgN [Bacillus sp. FJAT-45037]|uniref:flagellar protein FlgN n=1 Tax=Bacillus sp. FJAT-45037 TaxID=2011007 RepID=UPI000C238CC1|nr:flagellar protein FlgN [Bacillus sp. FJAT-45037]